MQGALSAIKKQVILNQDKPDPQPAADDPIPKPVDFTKTVEEVNAMVANNVEALRR